MQPQPGVFILSSDLLLHLPWMPIGLSLMVLHCMIGVIAAISAHQRGLSFQRWIWIGLLGGTIALIAALMLPPKTSSSDHIAQNQ
jgi:hypothetical protein